MSSSNGVIRIGKKEDLSEVERQAFGHWIAGFVDGEGHFGLRVGHDHQGKGKGIRIRPGANFTIGLRDDDIDILHSIGSFFQCGVIYRLKQRSNKNPAAHYVVTKPIQLWSIIVPHFEEFPLRAKKGREFKAWKMGVLLLANVSARRVRGLGAGYGTRPKWDEEELVNFQRLVEIISDIREYRP